MGELIRKLYDDIGAANSKEEFERIVSEYVVNLTQKGQMETAQELNRLAQFSVNKFSKTATIDNMKNCKKRVLNYIASLSYDAYFSENTGVFLVNKILENFHLYCKSLYREPIHKKCSITLQENLSKLEIENEYDVQQLIYPIIRALFPDARTEEYEDTGHHSIRKDIVIDSQDIVIELKCSRASMKERNLSEEVASDMIHYSNKYIFFYIYDRESVIKNTMDFKNTYEGKKIEGKKIYVTIFQPVKP